MAPAGFRLQKLERLERSGIRSSSSLNLGYVMCTRQCYQTEGRNFLALPKADVAPLFSVGASTASAGHMLSEYYCVSTTIAIVLVEAIDPECWEMTGCNDLRSVKFLSPCV